MRRRYWSWCGLLLWVLSAGCHGASTQPIRPAASAELIEGSIRYLASDELDGRGIGTQGLDAAANYIAGYFQGLGLRPAPEKTDFFQPFSVRMSQGFAAETALKAGATEGKINQDFLPLIVTSEGKFSGGVVFVGYGVTADKYDDYAKVDVRGKVVLAFRYEPHDANGKSRLAKSGWSSHAELLPKAQLAADRGAAALLIVNPPMHHGADMLTSAAAPRAGRIYEPGPLPVMLIRQTVAEEILNTAGAPELRTLQAEIDSKFTPASRALGKVRAEGNVAILGKACELRNVAAYLPGRGPHARECIVIGGHYDHIGRRPGGQVNPGADDNASGTAGVLELARMFSRGPRQERSLLFVTFTGEESGLLGSRYFVEHPLVPLDRIVAMMNLDMLGRMREQRLMVGGFGTSPSLKPAVDAACAGSGLSIVPTWANGEAPSDILPFARSRIPALFFLTGAHADLHKPTDTPDKIDFAAEAKAVEVVARTVENLCRLQRVAPTTQPIK